MPKRPPKEWFDDCVSGVKKSSPEIDDPNAVCGDLWYNKMSEPARRKAMKREENVIPYAPNPMGGGIGLIVGLAIVGGGIYWLATRDTKKSTKTTSETMPPSESVCLVTITQLNDWALSQDPALPVLYLYADTEPPSLDKVKAQWGTTYTPTVFEQPVSLIVVMKDGKFYKYDAQGNPVLASELRESYCKAYGA